MRRLFDQSTKVLKFPTSLNVGNFSVVTLLCDGGERYAASHYDAGWLAAAGIRTAPYDGVIERFLATGRWEG